MNKLKTKHHGTHFAEREREDFCYMQNRLHVYPQPEEIRHWCISVLVIGGICQTFGGLVIKKQLTNSQLTNDQYTNILIYQLSNDQLSNNYASTALQLRSVCTPCIKFTNTLINKKERGKYQYSIQIGFKLQHW